MTSLNNPQMYVLIFLLIDIQVNDGSAVSNLQAVVGSDVEGYNKVRIVSVLCLNCFSAMC